MRTPRSVAFAPMGMPSRILKPAIDFLARVICARWPVIVVSSSTALSSAFAFVFASPTPMFTVIFSMRGTSMIELNSNWSLSAGAHLGLVAALEAGDVAVLGLRLRAISGRAPPRSRRACRRAP